MDKTDLILERITAMERSLKAEMGIMRGEMGTIKRLWKSRATSLKTT